MIGNLPTSLEIDGEYYEIDSDFRRALLIMQMYNDRALSSEEKEMTMLQILFTPIPIAGEEPVCNIPNNINQAIEKAIQFLDVGQVNKANSEMKPIIDYEKDEQLLFSAVNSVFAKDVRSERYMHWWTFFGICQAIDNESLISHIMGIRSKLNNKQKLDESEKAYYDENKHLINIGEANDLSVNDIADKLRSIKNEKR